MTDFETRSFRVPFELRMEGENQTIVGYASTFDQPYPVDMVTEIIDRSAFTRTLSEKPDVYALIGHDPSRILGRTKNGTLSLSIDQRGLKCIITPVMTRDAEDTLKLIASGCIDAMSFGFKVVKQAFGYADGKTTRRITDLELHEVSCVAFPANENATLSLRAKQMAIEYRASRSSSTELETRDWGNTSSKGVVIEVLRFKMDSNGNKTVMVKTSPNGRAQAIQTNGNLPKTHSMTDDVSDMGAVDLGTIAEEVVKYLGLKPKNANKVLIEAEGKRLDWKQNASSMKLLELRNRIASPISKRFDPLSLVSFGGAVLAVFLIEYYFGGKKVRRKVKAKNKKQAIDIVVTEFDVDPKDIIEIEAI